MQSNEGFFKKLYPIILVGIVILSSVVMLYFVNAYAEPRIEAQTLGQAKGVLKELFPEMTSFKLENGIYIVSAGDKRIGYGFLASGTGYKEPITIMVALENETTVKGIRIVSQNETKGLGSRITLPSFTDMFSGQKIEDIRLKADGGQIDAISGSTVSSKAVINAVRETALAKIGSLPK